MANTNVGNSKILNEMIFTQLAQGLISGKTAWDALSASSEDLTTSISKLKAENDKKFQEEYSKSFVPDPKAQSSKDIKISDLPVVKPTNYRYYCETCHTSFEHVEEAADHCEMRPNHAIVSISGTGFAVDVFGGEPTYKNEPITKPEPKIKFGIDYAKLGTDQTKLMIVASDGGCSLPPPPEKPKPKVMLRPGQRKTLKLP